MARQKKADRKRESDDRVLIVKDCRIWNGESFREGSLLIENGKVRRIGANVPAVTSSLIKARGLLAIPGLIDVHVHLRDMQLSYKEDFTSGTSAAAAGGFTSVLDMPNTQPPVDSPGNLRERMEVATKKILVNVGFHAAAVKNAARAEKMADLGAYSFKLYMPHPVSPIQVERDEEILQIMQVAARSRIPVTVHAEEPSLIRDPSGAQTYVGLARTRPNRAESGSVGRILRLQGLSKCLVHFAHVTLPSSIFRIRGQHSSSVTSEVTPHHLLLSEEDLARLGWRAWMVPPLRGTGVSRRLLSVASRGLANLLASDHAPHSIREKKGALARAPPGVPGLETTLPLLLTLVNQGKLSMKLVIDMLTTNPARVFGMPSKGRLVKGADGDLVLVDLKKRSKVEPENFLSKAKYSPFEGFQTRGAVETTIVGGRVVFDGGQIVAPPGTGHVLRRPR